MDGILDSVKGWLPINESGNSTGTTGSTPGGTTSGGTTSGGTTSGGSTSGGSTSAGNSGGNTGASS